jgi:hypothetical protein
MKYAISSMFFVAVVIGIGSSATAANTACDSQYGVAKSNCVQQMSSRWAKDHMTTAAPATAVAAKPCDNLYGVAKTNCIQDLRAGSSSTPSRAAQTNAKPSNANAAGQACEGLYGVSKSNCVQDMRARRISASASVIRLAATAD